MNALAHLLGLLLALGGFAGLAMAMARQQEDTLGRELGRTATRSLRTGGWLLIGACLWLCIATWGWGLGLVIASGHTSAGAALVFCTLIVLDRRRVARAPAKPDRRARAAPAGAGAERSARAVPARAGVGGAGAGTGTGVGAGAGVGAGTGVGADGGARAGVGARAGADSGVGAGPGAGTAAVAGVGATAHARVDGDTSATLEAGTADRASPAALERTTRDAATGSGSAVRPPGLPATHGAAALASPSGHTSPSPGLAPSGQPS